MIGAHFKLAIERYGLRLNSGVASFPTTLSNAYQD